METTTFDFDAAEYLVSEQACVELMSDAHSSDSEAYIKLAEQIVIRARAQRIARQYGSAIAMGQIHLERPAAVAATY